MLRIVFLTLPPMLTSNLGSDRIGSATCPAKGEVRLDACASTAVGQHVGKSRFLELAVI